MIRRISMAAGIFLTLLLAVLVYEHFSDDERFFSTPKPATESGEQITPTGGGPMGAPTGKELYVERTDSDGRIVSIYQAESWKKRTPTTYDLVKPEIRYFRDDGEQIFIVADTGVVDGVGVGGKFQIKNGLLQGNVAVLMDRARDKDYPNRIRPDISQRPGDRVRIYASEMEFNDEDMAIHTDGRIAMFSREADLIGSGLTVQWNAWDGKIQELRSFRLARGEYMAIYDVDSEDEKSDQDDKSSQGEEQQSPSGKDAASSAGKASGAGSDSAVVSSQAVGSENASQTVTLQPAQVPPAGPTLSERLKPRNIYRAVFHKNVRVFYGSGSMTNANRVELTFNWDVDNAQSDDPKSRKGSASAKRSRPATAAVAADKAGSAGRTKPADESSDESTTQEATTQQVAKDSKDESSGKTTIILWDGPLEMVPLGRTDEPDSSKGTVIATGQRVVLREPEMTAVAQKLVLHRPQDKVELFGDARRPAIIVQKDEAVIVSPRIMMNRKGLSATMGGPGIICRALDEKELTDSEIALDEKVLSDPEIALELAELGQLPRGDSISWEKSLTAVLAKEPGDEKALYITDAWLDHGRDAPAGRVELVEAETGDFIKADKLYVHLARFTDQEGKRKSFPDNVDARGKVIAVQKGSSIKTDNLDVKLARIAREKDEDAPNEDEDEEIFDVKPTHIKAQGKVSIIEVNEDGRETQVLGDVVESYPQEGTADLTGNRSGSRIIAGIRDLPGAAGIVQDTTRLIGYDVSLNKATETVVVKSPGSLRFEMEKDLEGKTLTTPRPVDVSWTRHMDFLGAKNTAQFLGDVHFASPAEDLKCGELMLEFAKAPASQPASQPASAPATAGDTKTKSQLAMTGDVMSDRKIVGMVCKNDVILIRTELNDAQRVLRYTELRADKKLTHTAANKEISVEGPGAFLSADYELPEPTTKPEAKKPLAPSAGSGQATKPRQTAFQWRNEMWLRTIDENTRSLFLSGGVKMRHRSGDEIIPVDGMAAAATDGKKLPKGRKTALDCGKLWATFSREAPAAKAQDDSGAATQPDKDAKDADMGKLRRFIAEESVDMTDGPYTLVGHRLDYDLDNRTIVLEGTTAIDASIIYRSSADAMPATSTSKRIICDLDEFGRIVSVRGKMVSGGG